MSDTVLDVSRLKFSYREKEVLRDISFQVKRGDVFAVLGKNAAGKTTLVNILTGLLCAESGGISLCGEDITKRLGRRVKKAIGVMRPVEGVFEKMTCRQFLEFVAGLYEVPAERTDELMRAYELEGEAERRICKCSAGTRKKIEFCAAIMHDPEVLFLDEPFESVDPVVTSTVKEYIRSFAAGGKSVVITSHILEIIQNISNRAIIISDGKVAWSGDVKKGVMSDDDEGLESIFLRTVKNDEQA